MLTHGSRQAHVWLIFDVRQTMKRHRVVVAESATGKVRLPEDPKVRAQQGDDVWKRFESEDSALRFKDEILGQFPDLEVTIMSSDADVRGRIFHREGDAIRCREFTPNANSA